MMISQGRGQKLLNVFEKHLEVFAIESRKV
jgi:hypothetical protein